VKRFLHIVLVIVLAAACRGPRIIPKDTLTDIYVDMLMADQFVREENIPRKQLDTMLVYEAVFNKYGYDTDDYMNSVRYYLKDPERFSKVFEEVASRLEGEANALEKIIERQERLAQKSVAANPRVDSLLALFSEENMYRGLARFVRDTSRYPIGFHMVPVREDTLMIPADSLKAKTDTVAVEMPDEEEEEDVDDVSGNPLIIQETRTQVPVRVTSRPQGVREVPKEEPVEDVEDAR
jgi:hypothetical protein